VTKQCSGFLFLHFASIFLSVVLTRRDIDEVYDQCVWFVIFYNLDSLPGVGICYLCVVIMERIITKFEKRLSFLRSGNYGTPPSFFKFFAQLIIWMIISIISKIGTTIILFVFEKWLAWIHAIILLPFNSDPDLKTVVVVGVYPVLVTTFLFLVQDGFIRFKGKKAVAPVVKDEEVYVTNILTPPPEEIEVSEESVNISPNEDSIKLITSCSDNTSEIS
jgi:hypothetical protein